MNLEATLQAQGFSAELSISGRELVLLRTGEVFKGIIEPILPLELSNVLLGSDIREDAILHVLNVDCPDLVYGDSLMDAEASPLATAPALWKVVKRNANPADVEITFTLIKVTDKD